MYKVYLTTQVYAYIIIVRMNTSIIEYYNNYNYCVLGRVLINSIVVITASLFINDSGSWSKIWQHQQDLLVITQIHE